MPRFYFNMRDGDQYIEDPGGLEFPDAKTACAEALSAARAILLEKLERGEVVDGERFEITDDEGTPPVILRFRDSLLPQ